MLSFIKNWYYHFLLRWDRSKVKDFCNMMLGIVLLVAAIVIGTLSWIKGVSGIFIGLDLLAGSMAFTWSCLKGAEHISPEWIIWKDICSGTLGAVVFIAGAVIGIVSWTKGASVIFVILNFLAGTMGLIWFFLKALEVFPVLFGERSAYERELNVTAHALNYQNISSRVNDNEDNTSREIKITNSEIDLLIENIGLSKSRATYVEVVKSEANTVRCVSCKETPQICKECPVSGPVPGGKYIQKTEKSTNSIIQSPEGIYVPGNTAQKSYVKSTQNSQQPLQTQNIVKDDGLEMSPRAYPPVDKSATEDPYVICERIKNRRVRVFENQSYNESSSQNAQQPFATQNTIKDDRPELSQGTYPSVDKSPTEDPYVMYERIKNHSARAFENQSYESSELFGSSPKKQPECSKDSNDTSNLSSARAFANQSYQSSELFGSSPNKQPEWSKDSNDASNLSRYPIKHSKPAFKKQVSANTNDKPTCSEKGRDLAPQNTLSEGKTDFTADYSKPKYNLLANPHSTSPPPAIPPKTSYVLSMSMRRLPPVPAPRRLPRSSEDVAVLHKSPPLPTPRRTSIVNPQTHELTPMHRVYPTVTQRSSNVGSSGRNSVVPAVPPRRINVPVHSQPSPPPPIPRKQFMKH